MVQKPIYKLSLKMYKKKVWEKGNPKDKVEKR